MKKLNTDLRKIFLAWMGLLGCVALSACTLSQRPRFMQDLRTPAPTLAANRQSDLAPAMPPNAERGAAIYAAKCVACHGVSGAGDGPSAAQIKSQGKQVANLVSSARARAAKPAEWYRIIGEGKIDKLMPPFAGSLDAQSRWDVLAYVWSLGTTTQTLSAGRALYTEQCVACHTSDKAPRLDDPNLLASATLLDLSSNMSVGEAHQALKLTEPQRFQIADYVRSLAYQHVDPQALRKSIDVGDGELRYQAVMASAGVGPVNANFANAPVTLRSYDQNGEVFSRTTKLDASGVAIFDQLPRREDYFYQPEVLFDGVKFFAPPLQLSPGPTASFMLSGTVSIYPTTADPSKIAISRMFYAVQDVREGELTIFEAYFFDNTGDEAFVEKVDGAGSVRSLRITLPPDAKNLRFEPPQLGARFVQSGTAIFYSDLLEPQIREMSIALLYEIPYRNGRRIEREVAYPVTSWSVLLPEMALTAGTALRVTDLPDKGVQRTPMGNLHLYSSDKPLQKGSALAFELSGQPLGAAQPGGDGRAAGLGFIAAALAVAMGAFLFMRARAWHRADAATHTSPATHTPSRRDQLLSEIAALDAKQTQGKIDLATHQARRAELKAELMEIWDEGARDT